MHATITSLVIVARERERAVRERGERERRESEREKEKEKEREGERARERVGCRQEGDRHTETEKVVLFCWLFVCFFIYHTDY